MDFAARATASAGSAKTNRSRNTDRAADRRACGNIEASVATAAADRLHENRAGVVTVMSWNDFSSRWISGLRNQHHRRIHVRLQIRPHRAAVAAAACCAAEADIDAARSDSASRESSRNVVATIASTATNRLDNDACRIIARSRDQPGTRRRQNVAALASSACRTADTHGNGRRNTCGTGE